MCNFEKTKSNRFNFRLHGDASNSDNDFHQHYQNNESHVL